MEQWNIHELFSFPSIPYVNIITQKETETNFLCMWMIEIIYRKVFFFFLLSLDDGTRKTAWLENSDDGFSAGEKIAQSEIKWWDFLFDYSLEKEDPQTL